VGHGVSEAIVVIEATVDIVGGAGITATMEVMAQPDRQAQLVTQVRPARPA